MHCAFALMVGVSGVRLARHWVSRAFWASWPLLVAWVVIVTGNHYWIDVVLGWGVAAVAALVAAFASPASGPRPGPGEAARRGRPRPSPPAGSRPADRTSLTPMEPSAPPRAPGGRRNGRQTRNGQELRAYARERLIESRLTPNAISVAGLVGNLVAAGAGHPAALLPGRASPSSSAR